MQVRWNYKLRPNRTHDALMQEWLITLRKHRNYSLQERERGWNTNNRNANTPIAYTWGAYCELEGQVEYGYCCPLTCPVLKHGVMPEGIELTKVTREKVSQSTGETIPAQTRWGSFSDIQSKATTRLRKSNRYFSRVNADVLQRNLAKLDAAFTGFWQHGRGFPKYARRATFKSFEYKPGQVKVCDDTVYLPGIGTMRYFNSRPLPDDTEVRTVTVKQEADGWYLSLLLRLPEAFRAPIPAEDLKSNVGIDVGLNQLVSLSDGSHIENPRFGTTKQQQRRLRIRQRRVNRKVKGSNNRAKAGQAVARTHKKVRDKRRAYQWQAAKKIVDTAESVTHEELNIKGMKARCKPKRENGRFLPNGQSAKRALNRAISDASWGGLFQKIAWLALKAGKPVFKVAPHHTSQECLSCGHISKNNRKEEKFLCENCGHLDHADTQASRNLQRRLGLKFVSTRRKNLRRDSSKVVPVSYGAARLGRRQQGRNPKSKCANAEAGILEQLELFSVQAYSIAVDRQKAL